MIELRKVLIVSAMATTGMAGGPLTALAADTASRRTAAQAGSASRRTGATTARANSKDVGGAREQHRHESRAQRRRDPYCRSSPSRRTRRRARASCTAASSSSTACGRTTRTAKSPTAASVAISICPRPCPVGGAAKAWISTSHIKQSRFIFGTDTDLAGGGLLSSRLEVDLYGSALGDERATNTYGVQVRHAYIQYRLMAGRPDLDEFHGRDHSAGDRGLHRPHRRHGFRARADGSLHAGQLVVLGGKSRDDDHAVRRRHAHRFG